MFGPMRMSRLVLPLCRRTNGRIVTVTSVSQYSGVCATGGYGASKAACLLLMDTLRQECPDISVSTIAAGIASIVWLFFLQLGGVITPACYVLVGPIDTHMTDVFVAPVFSSEISDGLSCMMSFPLTC